MSKPKPLKIQLASDLHLECHRDGGQAFLAGFQNAGADVLVLAGDIVQVTGHRVVLDVMLEVVADRWKHVVYVSGNHERYLGDFQKTLDLLKTETAKFSNVHFLDNEPVEIDGVKIFAGTSWFPDPVADPIAMDARRYMNDFYQIKGLEPAIYESRRDFIEGLADSGADVVVSHHLPSSACVAPQYKRSALNSFFVSGVLDEHPCDAALWLFGHTHSQVDVTIEKTRCVANPYGYPSEYASLASFQNSLVLTVEPRRPTCRGCGNEIDPDTCHCGEPTSIYAHDNHGPVPMGCTCLYDRSL